MIRSLAVLSGALAAWAFVLASAEGWSQSQTAVIVDGLGHGDFISIGAALEAIPASTETRVRVFVRPGVYKEHLIIQRSGVSLIGLGSAPAETVITYDLNARTPVGEDGRTVGTTGSSSVHVNAPDFFAHNLTFANSTPDNIAQAVAIKIAADRVVFDHCRFTGHQDTLYPTGGRHYFRECYVEGDTDFIFGNATAVFDRCTIVSTDRGWVTAANTRPETPQGFVFLDCVLASAPDVPDGSVYLGRPWQWDRGSRAAVVFVRTRMGAHIAPAGWHPWHPEQNTNPAGTTRYAEFGSMDLEGRPLDVSERVAWARQLEAGDVAQLTVDQILAGGDGWDAASVIEREVAARPR